MQECAAGQRAESDREPDDPGPGSDRRRPLLRVGEDVGEDGQGGREDEGSSEAHQAPSNDEHVRRPREAGEGRESSEGEDADLEGTLSSVAVPEAAADEQESGEHQRIRVDDPLQLAVRGVELLADPGQRHVHDRVVNHGKEHAEAQDAENDPAPAEDCVIEDEGGAGLTVGHGSPLSSPTSLRSSGRGRHGLSGRTP